MRLALVDSGLGLLPTAWALRRLRPDVDLVLALDPEAMPWGALEDANVVQRVLLSARAAAGAGIDAVVVPCNTASTAALEAVRAEFEPDRPVVGTVPAVKPAAALGRPFAVWATTSTTASRYQAELVLRFAADLRVTAVACPGLAEAVEAADEERIDAAIDQAAVATPPDCAAVVLGCTHYRLVRDRIARRLPPATVLFDSAEAVARQTMRRLPAAGRRGAGSTSILLSGLPGELPAAAVAYPEGRALLRSALLR